MPFIFRALCSLLIFCVLSTTAPAQEPSEEITANQNQTPAGKLENGVLDLQLELRNGAWRPEADDGPRLSVPAFAEAGHPAQIPGPLLRMMEGTTVHVKVTNKLDSKATIYGFMTRPADPKASFDLAPGESRDLSFLAGAPGTYYYWARTTEIKFAVPQPFQADAFLNGAFVVDPPGAVPEDRVFVLSTMLALPDVFHDFIEVVSINGKSYPYTEPLEYTEGENIRWRVINPSFSEHPMHLHGAFYQILSSGDFASDKTYLQPDRQSVVTEDIGPGRTVMLEWKPAHPGRWLYHCHFHAHISSDERIPELTRFAPLLYRRSREARKPASVAEPHHNMAGMNDMAGLVLTINVKPLSASVAARATTASPPHKFDLVIEPTAAAGALPTFSCSVREGKKMVASEDKSMGPPIVVTRGEPTEITVLNHLSGPTTIHWHGLELDSYYDGVIGGGAGNQITPAIAAGGTFVARFTPNRAGTFIYHSHAADPNQISGGVYGALIVLEPGETFDPEHDKVLVLGSRDMGFFAKRLTINGSEQPVPMLLNRGVKYRLRLINMAPNLVADFQVGGKEHPAAWRALAKDGAVLPARLATTGDASLHIVSGETYDFEFQSDALGEIPLQVKNTLNQATLVAKIVLQ